MHSLVKRGRFPFSLAAVFYFEMVRSIGPDIKTRLMVLVEEKRERFDCKADGIHERASHENPL